MVALVVVSTVLGYIGYRVAIRAEQARVAEDAATSTDLMVALSKYYRTHCANGSPIAQPTVASLVSGGYLTQTPIAEQSGASWSVGVSGSAWSSYSGFPAGAHAELVVREFGVAVLPHANEMQATGTRGGGVYWEERPRIMLSPIDSNAYELQMLETGSSTCYTS